jgi:hypothetical protein
MFAINYLRGIHNNECPFSFSRVCNSTKKQILYRGKNCSSYFIHYYDSNSDIWLKTQVIFAGPDASGPAKMTPQPQGGS